jgi:hypothetical protein
MRSTLWSPWWWRGESGTLRATNVIGGIQTGYNWVLPGPYLFGLEADISGTDISSTVLTNPPGDPSAVAQWNDKVNTFSSRPARLHRRALALLRHRRFRLGARQVRAYPADGAADHHVSVH